MVVPKCSHSCDWLRHRGVTFESQYDVVSDATHIAARVRYFFNMLPNLQILEDIDEVSIKMEDTYYDENSTILEVSTEC